MTTRSEIPRPTGGELELLAILWDRGRATVRELFDAVNAQRPVVYTGVLKQLQIMTEKGLVHRDERDRAHIYSPAISREDTQGQFVRELSERFFAGSAAQLALHALEMEASTDEELDEIRKLLRKKKLQK
ncbi:MAG TPA: BlaI/MecI/CopY family transcriptional regulator [Acidobacteriaceae bacterium]|jgi:predicted transcriptional regulator|nr:BlaI/MecI/CopY family transcriptional regulator [Acidobacteriaceae bacterium]